MLVGCASATTGTVTLSLPTTSELRAIPKQDFTVLIFTVRNQIEEHRFADASAALSTMVCPPGQTNVARCPPPARDDMAVAWSIIGDLALDGNFVTRSHPPLGDADMADLAYARATTLPSSPAIWLYKLGDMRLERHRYEAALHTFLAVLDRGETDPKRDHKVEAIDGAADCIAQSDWDGDGAEDAVRGFARPEVERALQRDARYAPDLYAHTLAKMLEDDACDDAVPGIAEMNRRFPTNAATVRLASAVAQSCP